MHYSISSSTAITMPCLRSTVDAYRIDMADEEFEIGLRDRKILYAVRVLSNLNPVTQWGFAEPWPSLAKLKLLSDSGAATGEVNSLV
jgi:hypothetical protein